MGWQDERQMSDGWTCYGSLRSGAKREHGEAAKSNIFSWGGGPRNTASTEKTIINGSKKGFSNQRFMPDIKFDQSENSYYTK